MNAVLAQWNAKNDEEAMAELFACCGSVIWAQRVVAGRPYESEDQLRAAADAVWWSVGEEDWLAAFACHPRIGESAGDDKPARFERWSRQEQALVENADQQVREEIAKGNREYSARFGFTYIVCATGKSAEELLDILTYRLGNDRASEVREAAEQQRLITQIRIGKWLTS